MYLIRLWMIMQSKLITFFWIPLYLYGTLSYFDVRLPTVDELEETESVLLLTPEHFNAHRTRYTQQEEYMTDWEGQVRSPDVRDSLILADILSVMLNVF